MSGAWLVTFVELTKVASAQDGQGNIGYQGDAAQRPQVFGLREPNGNPSCCGQWQAKGS